MQFLPASDRSLLVKLESNALVHALSRRLQKAPHVTSLSPALTSLLIRFDPVSLTHAELESQIVSMTLNADASSETRLVEIPVRYDGVDLQEVAERHSLSTAAVIDAHSSTIYQAYFAGFLPGFIYLGEVPQEIATPRRATPRKEVPSGSVAIAGTQTGVYPKASPGGWNLLGHTDALMFDATQGRALVEPGDRVRFIPL